MVRDSPAVSRAARSAAAQAVPREVAQGAAVWTETRQSQTRIPLQRPSLEPTPMQARGARLPGPLMVQAPGVHAHTCTRSRADRSVAGLLPIGSWFGLGTGHRRPRTGQPSGRNLEWRSRSDLQADLRNRPDRGEEPRSLTGLSQKRSSRQAWGFSLGRCLGTRCHRLIAGGALLHLREPTLGLGAPVPIPWQG